MNWNLSLAILAVGLNFPAFGAAPEEVAPPLRSTEGDAHSEFMISVWQTGDGLPINVILSLQQTLDGYLWIGTSQGLVRFDGIRFELLFSAPSGPRYGSRFGPMVLDEKGRLWLTPDQVGMTVMDASGFVDVQTNGILRGRIESLCSDLRGGLFWVDALGAHGRISTGNPEEGERFAGRVSASSMWIRDYAGNIWLQTPRGVRFYKDGKLQDIKPAAGAIAGATPRRKGGLWLAGTGRLRVVTSELDVTTEASVPWVGETRVTAMLEDSRERLWLGTASHGLFCYERGAFRNVLPTSSSILCLFEDAHGGIWAGTRGGGLIQLRQRYFFVHDVRSGLANEFVNSLCQDTEGRVWIASAEGGLGWWRDGVWNALGAAEGWQRPEPLAVTPAIDRGVYVSTGARQILRWGNGKFSEVRLGPGGLKEPASDLLQDRQGRVWLVTDNAGISCFEKGKLKNFSTREGLPSTYMRRIIEDESGVIWAGDWEGGIVRLESNKWVTARASSGHGDAVRSMVVSSNTVWIGTSAGGLLRLRNGQTSRISIEQGLPDVCIQQLLLDGLGALWGGTPHRLFKLSLRQLEEVMDGRQDQVQAITYGRSDGLPATSFAAWNDPRCWRAANGELWFGTANGAIHFRPDGLPESKPPQPLLERMTLDGKPLNRAALKHLRAGNARITFHFTAPSLVAPDRVRFRYQLSGVDKEWVDAGTDRSATYASLPPGVHEFRVIASSPEGVWGTSPASVGLDVHPYFWQTNWFWAVIAAALAGGGVWLLRRAALRRMALRLERMRQERAVERERARIAQDIHDELGANLTSIGLIADMGSRHKHDPGAVGRELKQISDAARESVAAMDAIVWALNPRNDSLDHFANYLSLFARDFFRPAGLRTRLELPANLPVLPMSTETRHQLFLIVKESFNNIVRHAEAREVRVELSCEKNVLRLTISDDGKGLLSGTPAEGQDGLQNVRQRISRLGGTINVESGPGSGTKLDFALPLGHFKAPDV